MLVLVDPQDSRAVRNKDNILAWYDLMINKKRSEKKLSRGLFPLATSSTIRSFRPAETRWDNFSARPSRTGPDLGSRFTRSLRSAITFVGTCRFSSLFNDDPQDTGVAGVDIYKMDADGKAIEHWDVLQVVGTPASAANWYAPNIPAANQNGMF